MIVAESLRIPPHSVESEQSVLGALLLDNGAIARITIDAEDFYRSDHRLIWKAIAGLIDQSRAADVITVCSELEASGKLVEAGGMTYIGALAQNVPTAVNAHHYARIVRERAALRRVIAISTELADAAYSPLTQSVEALLDEAESKLLGISDARVTRTGDFRSAGEIVPAVVRRIDELNSNPGQRTGVATGFADLDAKTSGLQPGDLIIVASRPSIGKTAFALNMAEEIALVEGLPVAIFSMEMSENQIVQRMIGSLARVDQHLLRTGRVHEEDWPQLTQAWGRLNNAPIYIDDTGALRPAELRARARRLARKLGGLGLVIVDYLQLMSGAGENRTNELSDISRSLKQLAKELSCPVVALSQLNRKLEDRTNKRPQMADIRESGAIEQDADVILFIYRDEVYDPNSPHKGIAEINIAKQRNGPIGTIDLTFLGQFTRFENFAGVKSGYVPTAPRRGVRNLHDFKMAAAGRDD